MKQLSEATLTGLKFYITKYLLLNIGSFQCFDLVNVFFCII